MNQNYYYFVSALPTLALDERQKLPDPLDFLLLVREHVSDKDWELVSILRLPVDNINLIRILNPEEGPLLSGGNFTPEDYSNGLKASDTLPLYMAKFLSGDLESQSPLRNLSGHDRLSWLFYDFILSHSNTFLREWFTFELNMRNILVGLNCRRYNLPLDQHIIGRNEVAKHILKSHAPDFAVSGIFDFAEKICWLDSENPVIFEKTVDELRWNYANELSLFSYFGIERILTFIIHLNLAWRWERLKADVGEKQFDHYARDLVHRFQDINNF